MSKDIRKMPYYDTKIPVEKTRLEIEALLKQYRIEDISWTTLKGQSTLQFMLYINVKGVEKALVFEFRPPRIFIPRRQYNPKTNKYEKINFPHDAMSHRLLLWYLKSKLEAVEYGLEEAVKEFMSHIVVSLPKEAGTTTLGERIKQLLEEGRLEQIALPEEPADDKDKRKKDAIEV